MIKFFYKCVVTCSLPPLPCHKLSHLLGPSPPSSVTYFMDGLIVQEQSMANLIVPGKSIFECEIAWKIEIFRKFAGKIEFFLVKLSEKIEIFRKFARKIDFLPWSTTPQFQTGFTPLISVNNIRPSLSLFLVIRHICLEVLNWWCYCRCQSIHGLT